MMMITFSDIKQVFITNGKIGSSSLVSLPNPSKQYDRLTEFRRDYRANNFVNYKIVLMLRNPRDRFRSGLFTTLFFDQGKINRTENEWKEIIDNYLKNTGMFSSNPTSWEEYHCMPWLYLLLEDNFIEELQYVPVHISQLSRYFVDNNITNLHENNTDMFDNKIHFYNAFDEVIVKYRKQFSSLLGKDIELYNKWLVGEYAC